MAAWRAREWSRAQARPVMNDALRPIDSCCPPTRDRLMTFRARGTCDGPARR